MLNRLALSAKKGVFNLDKGYIKRWPSAPKVAFFGPPNVFADEIIKRYTRTYFLNLYF
jgi:hypothetical protein